MLEARREGLERYLQCLASVEPTPRELVEFLELPEMEEHKDIVTTQVFGYKKDPFRDDVEATRKGWDMITEVTLDTCYNL